jgi:uncharacterized membrane protein
MCSTPTPIPAEEVLPKITPLQTYERDIAEAIRSSNESVASINLAQQKRIQEKGGTARTEKIARKGLTLLISIVLIISTVVISALVYYFIINRPGPVVPTTPSVINTDEKRQIDVTGLKAAAVAGKIRAEFEKSRAQISVGKIVLLDLVEDVVANVGDITNPKLAKPSLDGTMYLSTLYPDDYKGLAYLSKNVTGQPVILEAQGDSYTDFARVSSSTGLPTVLGWLVHEWLWRGTYDVPAPRIEEVKAMYESTDVNQTKRLLQKYHVSYVFVGDMERQKYMNLTEVTFQKLGTLVFTSGNTHIYKLQ